MTVEVGTHKTHQTLRGTQVHHASGNRLIASSGLHLRYSEDAGKTWRTLAVIPAPLKQRIACKLDLTRRLLRLGIHAAFPAGDCVLVLANRQLFRVEAGEVRLLWTVQRGNRPLRTGICVVGEDVYVGDYFSNPEREPVRIYRINIDTGEWGVAHEFPAGRVRHVHLIQHDPRTGMLWVGTGDEDDECVIGTLCPKTSAWTEFGGGSQDWRAVSLWMNDESIVWGTDNHLGNNRLWRLQRNSQKPELVADVVGPVYYHGLVDDGAIFATTVEKGEGEQDEYGRLYYVDGEQNVSLIGQHRKDAFSPVYFGYGVMEFAEGRSDAGRCWVTLKGFSGGLRSELIEPCTTQSDHD